MTAPIAYALGSAMSTATGNSGQHHLIWAPTQGAWWLLYLTGTNAVSALYSATGSSWSTPSPASYTLRNAHLSEGRNFGFVCKAIGGVDVLGMCSSYFTVSPSLNELCHGRFRLDSSGNPSLNNTHAEAYYFPRGCSNGGCALGFSTTNRPFIATAASNGNWYSYEGDNVDSGTSWSAAFTDLSIGYSNESWEVWSSTVIPWGTGTDVLGLCDNGVSANSAISNIRSVNIYDGTGAQMSFGTDYTTTKAENWGCVARTTSDVHLVALTDNSVQLTHKRYNGTDWSTVSGDAMPALSAISGSPTIGTSSGVAVVTNGTNVWAFVVDSTRTIQYTEWISGVGWSSWAVAVTERTYSPTYLIACINGDASSIQLAWTESDGAGDYNIVGSTFSLSTPPVTESTSASLMMDF